MIVGRWMQVVMVKICHDIAAAAPPPSAPSPGGKGQDAETSPQSMATSTKGPTPWEAHLVRREWMTMAAMAMMAAHEVTVVVVDAVVEVR